MGHARTPLATLQAIDAVYADLPKLSCKRLCAESCGPILMSRVEWERICRRLGHVPVGNDSLVCPMLDHNGACKVYGIRPLICRLFGLVEAMRCPHGCVPERWLTDAEAARLLTQVGRLGR